MTESVSFFVKLLKFVISPFKKVVILLNWFPTKIEVHFRRGPTKGSHPTGKKLRFGQYLVLKNRGLMRNHPNIGNFCLEEDINKIIEEYK